MLILLLLLLQQAPISASIEGVVTKAGTSETVPRASVIVTSIQGQLRDVQTVIADDAGRFVVRNLAPGNHRVFATRDGFMRAEFGQLGPTRPGTPIVLTAGETRRNAKLVLTPLAVISGRVIDAEGKPVRNAFVRASQPRYSLGERTLEFVQRQQTNDLGEFRFFNLEPGSYYVMALPMHAPLIEGDTYVIRPTEPVYRGCGDDKRLAGPQALAQGVVSAAAFKEEAFKTVYYPGTTDPAAALPINLQPGAVFSGVELKTAKTPTVRIRGRAVNVLTGKPEKSIWVSLGLPGYGTDERCSSSHNDDGTFDFRAAPGTYVLTAENGLTLPAYKLGLWARMTLEVGNKDIDDIKLELRPGFSMKGRVVIEGRPAGGNDPDYERVMINLIGDNPVAGVRPEKDGTFIVNSNPLRTGSYRFFVVSTLPPRFYIKSARLGPNEVLDSGFTLDAEPAETLEILVSPNSATVSAAALDELQRPAQGITVVLVPDAKRRGRFDLYRSARTDAAGRVNFEGVAPGDYKLFAWEDIVTDAWQDPEVIRLNDSRGVALHLNENSRESVSVRVIQ